MRTRTVVSWMALALGMTARSVWAQTAAGCPSPTLENQACWLRATTGPTPEALYAEGVVAQNTAVDLDGDGIEEQTVSLTRPEMGRAMVLALLRRDARGWNASIELSDANDTNELTWSHVITIGTRRLAHAYLSDCHDRRNPVIHHTVFYAQRGGAVQRVTFDSNCGLVFPTSVVLPDGSIEFTHWTPPPRSRRVRSLVLQWNPATQQFTAGTWRPANTRR